MAESPRFRTALAAALIAAPALARAGEVPPSLLTDDMLQRYRAERTCDGGPGYAQIRSSLRVEAGAAQSARYMQRPELAQLEQRIANDYDRAARAAAARSCPEVARTLWGLILEEYTGPEHAEIRQRAEAALHELDTTPTRRPR